jgi:hypothetical protein
LIDAFGDRGGQTLQSFFPLVVFFLERTKETEMGSDEIEGNYLPNTNHASFRILEVWCHGTFSRKIASRAPRYNQLIAKKIINYLIGTDYSKSCTHWIDRFQSVQLGCRYFYQNRLHHIVQLFRDTVKR